ncbi:MAG: DUF3105 domain-containing protein [Actinobacteria bacterium]|nr:DUF3105 domain-containing protein [Actinomycetota bacterium]
MKKYVRRSAGAMTLGAVIALAGCGGGSGSSGGSGGDDAAAHQPRKSSVQGDGPAPQISSSVAATARSAGCTVRAFASEGRNHVEDEPVYALSSPPTSGNHNATWADWGVYETPLPSRFQMHNLEHGGVIVHVGTGLAAAARSAVRALWQESPAYLLVVPGTTPKFPPGALVVTSWQRWMVCKPYTAKSLEAVRAFRDAYRGAGPEPVPAVNSGSNAPGLPLPSQPDPAARP